HVACPPARGAQAPRQVNVFVVHEEPLRERRFAGRADFAERGTSIERCSAASAEYIFFISEMRRGLASSSVHKTRSTRRRYDACGVQKPLGPRSQQAAHRGTEAPIAGQCRQKVPEIIGSQEYVTMETETVMPGLPARPHARALIRDAAWWPLRRAKREPLRGGRAEVHLQAFAVEDPPGTR